MATFRKRGNVWRAELMVDGLRKSKTFSTKSAAKIWAAEIEFNLSSQGGSVSQIHTLRDVFDRYAEEVSPGKKGEKWEIIRLKALSSMAIADIKLVDLRREDFEHWIDLRMHGEKPVKSSTVNRELNLLSNCLTQARRWRLMTHKPMEDLKRPKDPPHRDRRIHDKEVEIILLSLGYDEKMPVTTQQQRVAVIFLIALETAMRSGEICGIARKSIHVTKRMIRLYDTKNGTPRDVPLSNRAIELFGKLKPWPKEGSVVGVTDKTRDALFRRAVRRSGIQNLVFHDTRHEAISRLAKKLDVLDLARMVGHRDIKMLMTYYNSSATDMAALLD